MKNEHKEFVIYNITENKYLAYNAEGVYWFYVPNFVNANFFPTKELAENEIRLVTTTTDTTDKKENFVVYQISIDLPM